MAVEWPTAQVGDVADVMTGFPFKSEWYTEDPSSPRLLRGDNVAQGTLRWDGAKRWGGGTADLGQYWLRKDDVILAMDRPWIEAGLKYASTRSSDLPALLVQRVARLRGTRSLETRYLRYVVGSQEFSDYITAVQTGTAVPHISGEQIRQFTFSLPPAAEQRAIAQILGALDDRIELNRRMSETLEGIARALFKSWFVDFDPVRAKSEGRDPGLPHEIAELFPNSFDASDLGPVPNGCGFGPLEDEFSLTMGQSPPGSSYNESGDGAPFYQGRADFGLRFPGRRVYCTAPTRLAEMGDSLVTVRAPVGHINIADCNCAIGRGVAAVRHRTGARGYTYLMMRQLKQHFERFELEGTVFGSITSADFRRLPVLISKAGVVTAFESQVSAIDDRIASLYSESGALTQIRDALLPKLISGEIRVKDAERLVGAAL